MRKPYIIHGDDCSCNFCISVQSDEDNENWTKKIADASIALINIGHSIKLPPKTDNWTNFIFHKNLLCDHANAWSHSRFW